MKSLSIPPQVLKIILLEGLFWGPETTNLMAHRPSQPTDSFVWAVHLKSLNFKVLGERDSTWKSVE